MNMKIIGVIPARYGSTRFPGKPIVDICGKPMIWWVYQQAKKVSELSEVYIATDDEKIKSVCDEFNMNCIITKDTHDTLTSRLQEFSEKIYATHYLCINGDEPLISNKVIQQILPLDNENIYVSNLISAIKTPSEVIDSTNIKVTFDSNSNALFMSRAPIPYPKALLEFDYYKHLGVILFSKESLEFFCVTRKRCFRKNRRYRLFTFFRKW